MESVVEENGISASSSTIHENESRRSTPPKTVNVQRELPPIELASSHQRPTTTSLNQLNTSLSDTLATNTITCSGNAPSPAAPAIAASVLTTAANIAQYPLTALAHQGMQVQSVIQAANQSSVIQTAVGTNATAASNSQAMGSNIHKSGVLFMGKPVNSTVIHTTGGNALQIPHNFQCQIKPEPSTQQLDTNSEDSLSDEDSPQRRNDLTRRPSYNKIFTEISGPDISAGTALQMSESGGLTNFIGSGVNTTGTLLHISQENTPAFFLPNRISNSANNSVIAEDQTRKREIRLQKNREAARECRRKKKEYIKCLENRVAVLENQNKALIEELKSLKELYCQTKNE